MNDFVQGVVYAVSMLVTLNDEPTLAADILEQAGYLDMDCRALDETEQQAMRQLEKLDARCQFKWERS